MARAVLFAVLFVATPAFANDVNVRLWDTASHGDLEGVKAAIEDGADVDYATDDKWVITTAPNALCAPIHNRMPVILDPADWQTWLGEVPVTSDELQAVLRPFPAELMEAHEIGPRIGNVKNDDAALIERLNPA